MQIFRATWLSPKKSRGHRNEKIRGGHLDGHLGCDIGGAKELRVIYFPIIWGAKEPQNLPNHGVVIDFCDFFHIQNIRA